MITGVRREILIYPDPILQQIAKPVSVFDDKLKQIVADLFETLYEDDHGVGLAANQIGVLQRVFVFDETGKERQKPLCFINPTIIESSGSRTYTERCLSLPDCPGVPVTRFEKIKLEYYDIDGKVHHLEPDSILLTVGCQHELDHLNGVTIFNYIKSNLKKTIVLNKLIKKKKKSKS